MSTGDPLGLLGTTLDERIAIEEVIGEGGFGIVYRGRHLGFEEPVAVKCLKIPAQLNDAQREDIIRRFKHEARTLHRLSRKTAGIVQALDVGAWVTPTGTWAPYIVMEWLNGSTLEQDLRQRAVTGRGPRTLLRAVELLTPVAQALGVAHAHNIAHLDVKPANLFIGVDDDEVSIKVLDFGVAKAITASKTLTRALTAGTRAGHAFTPQYAAPEQFDKRHGRLGPHSDVFALGLVLLELVSGKPALSGDTPLQLYMSAVNEIARPSFATFGIDAGAAAEDVLRCALAVDSKERFGDAATMWEALSSALGVSAVSARTPLSTVVHSEVIQAATIADTHARTTGHNRLCTILVAELRGTAALAARFDPEQVAQVVDRCLEGPRREIEALGGTVHELATERIVAIFGLGADELNAAERAVMAALRVRTAVSAFAVPQRIRARLGVRTGIHTGRIYVSVERQTRVTGTPLTLATELSQRAPTDAILIGRDTQRQIAGLFDVEAVTLPPATEDDLATSAYRVIGVAKTRHDLKAIARIDFLGVATRFIGRDAELGELSSAVDAVLDARISQQILLLGERGLGKSRLLVELAGRLRREGFFVLAAASQATSTQVSYGVAASLLRSHYHLHEDEPYEAIEAKLRAGIREMRPGERASSEGQRRRPRVLGVDDLVEPLMCVLGIAPMRGGDPSTAHEDNERMRSRIAAAFAAMLDVADKPVAILADDVQWADAASLALIDELSMRSEQPMLVVCAAQPGVLERHTTWADRGERRRVEVKGLARRHLEQMARDRLREAQRIPEDLVTRIATRAEGNPLALVEMLHLLVDAGAIVTHPEGWEIDASSVGEIALPTTVQAIVQARLDRLGAIGREALCHAAVIGRTFWSGALATLLERSTENLAPTIARLLGRELLREEAKSSFPEERELWFAESSTHEVAHEMLGATARRVLHKKVAEWLEARVQSDAMAALIAEHYESARALTDAAEAYARAGRYAASLGQNEEAVSFFERACRLDDQASGTDESFDEVFLGWERSDSEPPVSWPNRVRLRYELADVLRLRGRIDEAEACYAGARTCIVHDSDVLEAHRWQGRLDYRMAMLGELRGDVEPSLALLQAATEHAEAGGIFEEKAQMLALVAALEQRKKDDAASQRACLEGLRVLRSVENRSQRWAEAAERLLRTLGGTLYRRGRFFGAERCYLQGLRIIDERAFPHLASRIYNNVAATRYARGDIEKARASFQSALELAERGGEMVVIMTALANLGEVELALDHAEVASSYLEEAIDIGERIGAAGDLADAYRNLAAARHALGQEEAGFEAGVRALELATGGGRLYLPHVVETLTEICAATGCAPAGERLRVALGAAAAQLGDEHAALAAKCAKVLG